MRGLGGVLGWRRGLENEGACGVCALEDGNVVYVVLFGFVGCLCFFNDFSMNLDKSLEVHRFFGYLMNSLKRNEME